MHRCFICHELVLRDSLGTDAEGRLVLVEIRAGLTAQQNLTPRK